MTKPFASAALALAVVAGGVWYLTKPAPSVEDPLLGAAFAEDGDYDASLVTEMVQGNPDSPVEVVEYASFTCPHCATFHAQVYPRFKADYIDTGLIRFVYREAYFDRPGLWASMVARCGGEMRYFGITKLLFERQSDWIGGNDAQTIIAGLRNIGKIAGLSDADLDACMTDGDTAAALVGWYETNLEALDVDRFGTPSFVIAGEYHSNMSYSEMSELIDAALVEAGIDPEAPPAQEQTDDTGTDEAPAADLADDTPATDGN
ncbi:MAG: Protein-disulfide isomerase [Rhodobacteraceae bacterium HLUCCA08]|nr:MAG: Protein-disulfide isomerase [Rhodobacteraceae bacterium HLUCCA08]